MKRAKRIGFLAVASVLVSIVILWYMVRVPNKEEPNRLSNIPVTAIWKGAVDEGFWLDLVDVNTKEKTYRIKVYNDYEGEVVMDADFAKQDSCTAEYPLNNRVFEYVSYFEFDKIVMSKKCDLKIIKTYSGSFMEVDKE